MYNKIVGGICIVLILVYLVLLIFGVTPQLYLCKFGLGLILAFVSSMFFGFAKKDFKMDVKHILISQVAILLGFFAIVVLSNMKTNVYNVEKMGTKYVMQVNVNNNSKEYYRVINKLLLTSKPDIVEYLKDTTLSYEENTPVKIVYNNGEVNKEAVECERNIHTTSKLTKDRVYQKVRTYDELTEIASKYDLDVSKYSKDFFENKEILAISYIPMDENILYTMKGEDNNMYLFIQSENFEDKKTAFMFIVMNKVEYNDIFLLSYEENIKNKILK